MPRKDGPSSHRLLLILVVAVLLVAFTPISKALLSTAHGSFSPTPYSSLALKTKSDAVGGIVVGEPVAVQLNNHTGHTETYHWTASQKGSLVSLGETTVGNGQTITILVPSRGAVAGSFRIALGGTDIFVTVPLLKA